MSLKMSL